MQDKKQYFFAYGTNISKDILTKNCPGAELVGYGMLNNYVLEFRGYNNHAIANLAKQKNEVLPVAVWDMPPESRYTIDNFEKFPYLYKHKRVKAVINGKKIKGIIYILKQELPHGTPSEDYLQTLRNAYQSAEFDEYYINSALERNKKYNQE